MIILTVGLNRDLLRHAPFMQRWAEDRDCRVLRPDFPAVTCTSQTSILTGQKPATHGIVGNGWYDRKLAEIQFWKQSNHLVESPPIWETWRKSRPDLRVAQLFWWYNMHAKVDFAVTPRPQYRANGRKLPDIHTRPMSLRDELQGTLGPFPLFKFWGPMAGIESTRWIVDAAMMVHDRYQPDVQLVYLPHLDYGLQKLGPGHAEIPGHVRALDDEVRRLVTHVEGAAGNGSGRTSGGGSGATPGGGSGGTSGRTSGGGKVVVLSEYGIEPVDHPVFPNRMLDQWGMIQTRREQGRRYLDPGESDAFAVCDHQVAHVYVQKPGLVDELAARFRQQPGIERVLTRSMQADIGLDHPRSGDLVLVADSGCWFGYYFWQDDREAPDYARTVDIHKKPGYDPVELFVDPAIRLPKLKIGAKILARKLGFANLLDVIPLDASLVRGSHGRVEIEAKYRPVVILPGGGSAGAAERRAPAGAGLGENAGGSGSDAAMVGEYWPEVDSAGLHRMLLEMVGVGDRPGKS